MIRHPKAVLTVLTALNLLNYVDRYVLSAVVSSVQADLGLSGFMAGLLPTIFLVGYFATSPVFGHLADRGGPGRRRRLLAFGVAGWSAATIASGLAPSALAMAVSRALVGVGEAAYSTLAPTLIDDIAPAERRGSWLSIFYAALPIGSALGYVIGGKVMDAAGWRAAFLAVGIPGILCALLCLLLADPPRASATGRADDSPPRWRTTVPRLARISAYRNAVLGYCAYSFAIGGFAFWAPTYVHLRFGLPAGKASVMIGGLTVVGGLLGTLLGGTLADAVVRRDARTADASEQDRRAVRANLGLAAVACAVGTPLAAVAIAASTVGGFRAAALPCQVALFLLTGPINVAILRSAPPELRASAMALSTFAIHALGDLWSPPLIGFLKDRAPMETAMCAVPLLFGVAAVIWGLAIRSSTRLTWHAPVR